ncbi:MAG: hypothetical protein EOO13_16085 [Chitinophagaceae bacterium]|nr:MAG: hypothetical protein EOO13_16085 [Chitinophagaceae bacterium]
MKTIKKTQAEQYMHETLSWERTMAFYRQENIFFKTRLAEVLDHNADTRFTEWAEEFNNQFIFNDDYILSLLQDVELQQSILRQTISGDHSKDNTLEKFQLRLRQEIEKFEQGIADLKHTFNQQLAVAARTS